MKVAQHTRWMYKHWGPTDLSLSFGSQITSYVIFGQVI